MKKTIILLGVILSVHNQYASIPIISDRYDINLTPATTDSGMVINGVKWATRNVDKPGTFAANPENTGMCYKWNCNIGWSLISSTKTENPRVATPPEFTCKAWENCYTWEKNNDPCPAGWRVPTLDEIKSLLDTGKVNNRMVIKNERAGRRFTDKATGNSIFLPDVGWRYGNGSQRYRQDDYNYWSGTATAAFGEAYYLNFGRDNEDLGWSSGRLSLWNRVRCVSEAVVTETANVRRNPIDSDKGVIINGVKWATRNVDKPGTFAAYPEENGMYYQWNRKTGRDGPCVNCNTKRDNSAPPCGTWEKVNDPSPSGWRVPTLDEFKTLLDSSKVSNEWTTTEKGIDGRIFTDKATGNSIFLPATGFLFAGVSPSYEGKLGYYWSSTVDENIEKAHTLFIYSKYVGYVYDDCRRDYPSWLSIRSVADEVRP